MNQPALRTSIPTVNAVLENHAPVLGTRLHRISKSRLSGRDMFMTHHPGDFIAYPTNRVVGTIADAAKARAAIEELLRGGVDREDIDILHGEDGLHRLDPSGAEHGFLARFQRTVIRLAGPAEESVYLQHHVEDVRDGRFVIMVLAEMPDRRDLAAGILNDYGAEFVGFYGVFAWTSLYDRHGSGRRREKDIA